MSECLFCKITNGDIPCEKVFEDDEVLAFRDIDPQAPVHILIIPKKHIDTLNALSEIHANLIGKIVLAATSLAAQNGLAEGGYRLVWNCNRDGGQAVYHLHLHLLGGRKLTWPPG